jgi:hypothetical protein
MGAGGGDTLTQYPAIGRPLPPDLITLSAWAASVGRSSGTVRARWSAKKDFPDPVARTPGRGRNGGGLGELVYRLADLNAWLPEPVRLNDGDIRPDQLVTLGWFADHVAHVARKTVTQYRGKAGFPAAEPDGRYRYSDLAGFWRSRPGRGRRSS